MNTVYIAVMSDAYSDESYVQVFETREKAEAYKAKTLYQEKVDTLFGYFDGSVHWEDGFPQEVLDDIKALGDDYKEDYFYISWEPGLELWTLKYWSNYDGIRSFNSYTTKQMVEWYEESFEDELSTISIYRKPIH